MDSLRNSVLPPRRARFRDQRPSPNLSMAILLQISVDDHLLAPRDQRPLPATLRTQVSIKQGSASLRLLTPSVSRYLVLRFRYQILNRLRDQRPPLLHDLRSTLSDSRCASLQDPLCGYQPCFAHDWHWLRSLPQASLRLWLYDAASSFAVSCLSRNVSRFWLRSSLRPG